MSNIWDGPVWPPEDHSHFVEYLVDITSDRRVVKGRVGSILDGYRAVVFRTETEWTKHGPIPDHWWPMSQRSSTMWTCEHDHATKAEAVTCAYERLVACWPGQ